MTDYQIMMILAIEGKNYLKKDFGCTILENLTNYQYASCGLQLKELYISNQIKRVDGFLYSDTSNI